MSLKDKWTERLIGDLRVLDVTDNEFFAIALSKKENDKNDICSAEWDFFANNITENIKNMYLVEKVDDLNYLAKITDRIMEKLNIKGEYEDVVHTLAYIVGKKMDYAEDLKREQAWIDKGYVYVTSDSKEYADKKVSFVMRSGYDGKWRTEESGKGRTTYSKYDKDNSSLFILPGKCRSRGYWVREAMIKVIENKKKGEKGNE